MSDKRRGTQDRWAATAIINIIRGLQAEGREQDARTLISAFEIFHSFASNVHVRGKFFEASVEETSAELGPVDTKVFVLDSGYKFVNNETVSVSCIPLSMILRAITREFKEKNEKGVVDNPVPSGA